MIQNQIKVTNNLTADSIKKKFNILNLNILLVKTKKIKPV